MRWVRRGQNALIPLVTSDLLIQPCCLLRLPLSPNNARGFSDVSRNYLVPGLVWCQRRVCARTDRITTQGAQPRLETPPALTRPLKGVAQESDLTACPTSLAQAPARGTCREKRLLVRFPGRNILACRSSHRIDCRHGDRDLVLLRYSKHYNHPRASKRNPKTRDGPQSLLLNEMSRRWKHLHSFRSANIAAKG
jgi:hypothetical protein